MDYLRRPYLIGIRDGVANIIRAAYAFAEVGPYDEGRIMAKTVIDNLMNAVLDESRYQSSCTAFAAPTCVKTKTLRPISVYVLYGNSDLNDGSGHRVRLAVAQSLKKAQEAGIGCGVMGANADEIMNEEWWQDENGDVYDLSIIEQPIELQEARTAARWVAIKSAIKKLTPDEIKALGLDPKMVTEMAS